MKIQALPKPRFDEQMRVRRIDDSNVEDHKNLFLISINSSPGFTELEKYKSYFKEDHANVLRLFFDDVEFDGQTMNTTKAMTAEHAKQIIGFAKKFNVSSEVLVHCAAGKSRSVAVAHFLCELFGENVGMVYDAGFQPRDEMEPNKLVYRLLEENKL